MLPSLISTDGRTSHVLLAYVMPWTNEASLALYNIARIIVKGLASVPCRDQPEVWKLYCAVDFITVIEASKLVTIEVESRSLQTPSP